MDPKFINKFQPANIEPESRPKSAKWFIITFIIFGILIISGIGMDVFSFWSRFKERKNIVPQSTTTPYASLEQEDQFISTSTATTTKTSTSTKNQ